MYIGGGNVEVVAERGGSRFRQGFDIIADTLVHDPFQPLPILMEVLGER